MTTPQDRKEESTTKSLFGALMVVFLIVAGCAVQAEESPWSVEGLAVTADSCVIGCPCIFGEQPSHDSCRYVGIFQVEEGHYGELDLGDTRFALAGEFSRANEQGEQEYLYVAYYVDSGAASEQQEALRKILTGPAFAPLGEPAEVGAFPILVEGLESFGQVGVTYWGEVGEIATVNVTPIQGSIAGQPLVVENSADLLFQWTALGRASSSFFRSGGQDFSFEGTSGESHKFAFSGGGSEETEASEPDATNIRPAAKDKLGASSRKNRLRATI